MVGIIGCLHEADFCLKVAVVGFGAGIASLAIACDHVQLSGHLLDFLDLDADLGGDIIESGSFLAELAITRCLRIPTHQIIINICALLTFPVHSNLIKSLPTIIFAYKVTKIEYDKIEPFNLGQYCLEEDFNRLKKDCNKRLF